jgi:hypothetical protein
VGDVYKVPFKKQTPNLFIIQKRHRALLREESDLMCIFNDFPFMFRA